ncbi:hypothetical protein CL657_03485 [bacterium]|nr:hypothetical protein [bacterium]|tara:strand:+ start:689 stop:1309 length:621 start_codon:yes stop_codon:yes gene_type:complete
MKLNDYIKLERKKKKLTLVQLAKKASISYGMLYRLEEGNIKQPKPNLLKKVAEALELNYESILLKFGYIGSNDFDKKRSVLKEKEVYNLTDFSNASTVVGGTILSANPTKNNIVVKSDTDDFLPMFKTGDILELKKVSNIISNEIYLRRYKNNINVVIGKKRGSETVLVDFLRLFQDVDSSSGEFYKLISRYSDETLYKKTKTIVS